MLYHELQSSAEPQNRFEACRNSVPRSDEITHLLMEDVLQQPFGQPRADVLLRDFDRLAIDVYGIWRRLQRQRAVGFPSATGSGKP